MDCLDEVNFNLVPRDRASTAALGTVHQAHQRCPACDNCRNTRPGCRTHDNGNLPTTDTQLPTFGRTPTSPSGQSPICLCPVSTSSPTSSPSNIHIRDTNFTPGVGSPFPSLGSRRFQSDGIATPKSSSPSSSVVTPASSPSSSSSPFKSLLDHPHPPVYVPSGQSGHTMHTASSCHPRFPSPSSSPTTDPRHRLEGLTALPPTDTATTTTFSNNRGITHSFLGTDHEASSITSPFRRADSNPDHTVLSPFESHGHSPPHTHNQSQPIPIHSSSRRQHHHHNDTDITQGLSLTPSAFPTPHSWDPPTHTPTTYNPFASSPAERLSLHFYSQQSPKYFKQPSSSTSPTTHGRQGQGHEIHSPTVFDRWPIGLSPSPSHKKTGGVSHGAGGDTNHSLVINAPPSGNKKPHSYHHNRRRPRNSWRSRRAPQTDPGSSSGEDDVTMTPVDGPIFPTSIPPGPTPDLHLPQELLSQLHDLEHENEDLSADVVSLLDSKGFAIHEVLGKGISSTVRRVTEKTTGIDYAVKIIDISGEKGDSEAVEQTKKDTVREIQILRLCGSHANIIHMHDVFETPTFIFLVFELCRQGELFDYLTSVVSLSEKRTRIIMRQLLDAVQYIHGFGIVHRDLKPENILMDDDLNIKVSDFGFAIIVEKGEELGELCGTPGYLAPEVLAHSMYENVSGYGQEVDMWACGVIMYTLLCGAPPFWNRRQMIMLRAIMNADYTFNSPEWDDISEAPKDLIQKLLVVNPKDRLTAREALEHPFFQSKDDRLYSIFRAMPTSVLTLLQLQESTKFKARRKFRGAVFCVMFYKRLTRFYKHPPPISVDTLHTNPYSIKLIRKAIDTCAFSMYRHWVKRVDNQNRAALFEHTLRDEWKQTSVMSINTAVKATMPHK